jgi:hypothetical protein
MSTKDVANKLVSYCRSGNWEAAYKELYSPSIQSTEMPGMPNEKCDGMEAVMKKSEQWMGSVVEMHKCEVSEPVIAEPYFTVKMDMDVTFKERGRQSMQEICVYKVKDNAIVSEQFFYNNEEPC